MKSTRLATGLALLVAVPVLALAGALVFGGPKTPPPMASINDPFKAVDFSGLPPLRTYAAEGAALAYRYYAPQGADARGSVVLVHGSSASSESMHVLARSFAQAGYAAYALDMRGHGASGEKGRIAYIGQLEDDLARFVQQAAPPQPVTLVGFSAGGGFTLRVAGSDRQDAFHSCVLLSPFLGPDAPNYRAGNGGWAEVGVPRVVALSLLHKVHVDTFHDLPVVRYALNEQAQRFLTTEYSFSLASNFRPRPDYAGNIRAVRRPCAVLAGAADETFASDKLEGIVRGQGKDWPVTLLPGINHIGMIVEPRAVQATVQAVAQLRTPAH